MSATSVSTAPAARAWEQSGSAVVPLLVWSALLRQQLLLGKGAARVQVQYRMAKPIPSVSQLQEDMDRQMSALQADTLFRFAQHAKRHPAAAAGLQVTVLNCTSLRVADASSTRPYVHYQFPGHPQPVDTAIQPGPDAVFDEKRTFEFAPDPQTSCLFLSKLGEERLQLHVFDAGNAGEHVGSASVPLRCADAPCACWRLAESLQYRDFMCGWSAAFTWLFWSKCQAVRCLGAVFGAVAHWVWTSQGLWVPYFEVMAIGTMLAVRVVCVVRCARSDSRKHGTCCYAVDAGRSQRKTLGTYEIRSS